MDLSISKEKLLRQLATLQTPENCFYCEYDRQFPETAGGGWMYMGNNGPIHPCPVCNPTGAHPRQ